MEKLEAIDLKIYKTKDYSKFQHVTGNRSINANKANKIVRSVNEGLDLFMYCPIIVDSNMNILDGQHRLAAAIVLNTYVYFVIYKKEFTIQEIADLNSNISAWKINDFINCYCNLGNEDFKTLRKFSAFYSLNASLAARLLMDGVVTTGGGMGEYLRDGSFKVLNRIKADLFVEKLKQYRKLEDSKGINHRHFFLALQKLIDNDHYNHDEIIDKLTGKEMIVERKESPKEYISHIEELFNKGNSKRRIIYQ